MTEEKMIIELGTACRQCYEVCRQTFDHFLVDLGGVDANCLRLLLDCAGACVATADYIRLQPEFLRDECQRCSAACRDCAKALQDIEGEMIEGCVYECNRCAEICEEILESSERYSSSQSYIFFGRY